MAKEVKIIVVDIEVSDAGGHEPGETPPVHGEAEFLQILQSGCGATYTVGVIESNLNMKRALADTVYEVTQI